MELLNLNDILGILVLYNSTLDDSDTIQSLNQSLEKNDFYLDMFVYDNSRSPKYLESKFIYKRMNIYYINDISNSGVSKAYNSGATYANYLGKKWILLLDQDTKFPENSFNEYLSAKNNIDSEIKIIVPTLLFENNIYSPSGYYLYRTIKCQCKTGVNFLIGKTLLNSGLFINLNLFIAVGGFNENIPLDFSDTSFIEKVKKSTNNFYLLTIKCSHNLSSDELDIYKIKERFKYYVQGTYFYAQERKKSKVLILFWVLLRTLKLSIRHSEIFFLRYLFSNRNSKGSL